MDKSLVEVLLSEIKNQCEMVRTAVEGINNFQNEEDVPSRHLWFNVQGLLVATANISKILWNYSRDEIEEVSYLKGLLNLSDNSKIKSRFFRNLFEHYDEYLIDWGSNSGSRSIATSNIMPKEMRLTFPVPIENTFKTYYSDINTVAFQNREYALQPVIDEIALILAVINSIDDVYYSDLNSLRRQDYGTK